MELLNEWWNNEHIPEEDLRARVVLIFKKGDTSNFPYRPISLLNATYKIFASIIQTRLEDKIEDHLQETQFGFRKQKGTADALNCIRRIIEKGEMTGTKTILMLLDWEKAFDKVRKNGLLKVLERMGVEKKMLAVIEAMYNKPTFMVEMEGQQSAWKTQETGIRQGCPLSPYLFIILMTVLFHDIHRLHTPNEGRARIKGANFDEVLYADDTICVSQSEVALEKKLKAIEADGNKYGLKLNKAKCEILKFGDVRAIHFEDGSIIKVKDKVKYLGCKLNNEANPAKELQDRMSDCILTLKKLDGFWLHRDSSVRQKLLVFNAVIRSKIAYGLEAVQLNQTTIKKLDTLQLKGLRKILNVDTTYGNMQKGTARTNTNKEVYRRARAAVKEEVDRKYHDRIRKRNPPRISHPPTSLELDRLELWHKRIKAEHWKHQRQLRVHKASTYYKQRKLYTLGKLIRDDQNNPATAATLDTTTLQAIDHGKQMGRPRDKWLDKTIN